MFKFNNYIAIFGNTIFSFFWSPLQIAAYMDRQPSWIYLILIHLLPHMALYNLRCYLELLAVPPAPAPVPGRPQEPWGSAEVVREMAPSPPVPRPPGHGVAVGPGSCWPETWESFGPSGARRKRPQTPRHLGAFQGPKGLPCPGPTGPRFRLETCRWHNMVSLEPPWGPLGAPGRGFRIIFRGGGFRFQPHVTWHWKLA